MADSLSGTGGRQYGDLFAELSWNETRLPTTTRAWGSEDGRSVDIAALDSVRDIGRDTSADRTLGAHSLLPARFREILSEAVLFFPHTSKF